MGWFIGFLTGLFFGYIVRYFQNIIAGKYI